MRFDTPVTSESGLRKVFIIGLKAIGGIVPSVVVVGREAHEAARQGVSPRSDDGGNAPTHLGSSYLPSSRWVNDLFTPFTGITICCPLVEGREFGASSTMASEAIRVHCLREDWVCGGYKVVADVDGADEEG